MNNPNLFKKTRAVVMFSNNTRVVCLIGEGIFYNFAIPKNAHSEGVIARVVSLEPEYENCGYLKLKNLKKVISEAKLIVVREKTATTHTISRPHNLGEFHLDRYDILALDLASNESNNEKLIYALRKIGISVTPPCDKPAKLVRSHKPKTRLHKKKKPV